MYNVRIEAVNCFRCGTDEYLNNISFSVSILLNPTTCTYCTIWFTPGLRCASVFETCSFVYQTCSDCVLFCSISFYNHVIYLFFHQKNLGFAVFFLKNKIFQTRWVKKTEFVGKILLLGALRSINPEDGNVETHTPMNLD